MINILDLNNKQKSRVVCPLLDPGLCPGNAGSSFSFLFSFLSLQLPNSLIAALGEIHKSSATYGHFPDKLASCIA